MLVQSYVLIPLRLNSDVSAAANTLLGVRLNSWDSGIWNIADWTRSKP
jgi:peptide/nickel transport system substrate-binding protein